MIGEINLLKDLIPCNDGFIVFGDGSKGRIQGIGNVCIDESPKIENVLLLKGLVCNLISISQLCDQRLDVKFNKTKCLVTNQKGEVLINDIRSKNNCYRWVPYYYDQIF